MSSSPTPHPRRRVLLRLRARLLETLAVVGPLDEPLRVAESDGVNRATLTVEPAPPAEETAGPASLPTPLLYSADELQLMLAIGVKGAMLIRQIARKVNQSDNDPRLKERLRGLRARRALGHCKQGYFWRTGNPELGDDEDEPEGAG